MTIDFFYFGGNPPAGHCTVYNIYDNTFFLFWWKPANPPAGQPASGTTRQRDNPPAGHPPASQSCGKTLISVLTRETDPVSLAGRLIKILLQWGNNWKEYFSNLLVTTLLHRLFFFLLETSNFGYLLIFWFFWTMQSFRKIGQQLY